MSIHLPLSGVLVVEQQVEALRFCTSNNESKPGVEPDVEPDHVTDSDGLEEAAEGMCDKPMEGE